MSTVAITNNPAPQSTRHERWCDHSQHALTSEGLGYNSGCVGRAHKVTTPDGFDLGGWWQQDGQGAPARFVVDRATEEHPGGQEVTLSDLKLARSLFAHLTDHPIGQAIDLMLGQVISDHESGITI